MIRNLIALLLLTSQAFAGLPPTTLKGQGGSKVTTFNFQVPLNQATQVSGVDSLIETGNRNILPNPGFEGTTGWTASGGATSAINTTAVGTGVNGYDWDSNSASQTLTGTAVTIPNGLKGKNGVVSCNIYTVSGSATHLLKAYDGTNDVASGSITSVSGSFVRTSINFVFPSSGTITVRLTSVASNEPEIYVDDCYLGPAVGFNVSQVNQATLLGSAKWPATANCEWSQSGAGTFTADTDCTNPSGSGLSGQASAPATKVPGIRFANGLPPGEYLVMAIGSFYCNNSTNNCVSAISLSDGTNRTSIQKILGSAIGTTTMAETVSAVVGRFNYTTAQGDTTIQLYSEAVAAGNLFVNANTSSTVSDLQFLVYRFPSSSEIAYRPETQNNWGSTYWPDGTASFTTTSATYTAVTVASLLGTAVRTGQSQVCADTNAICSKSPSIPTGCFKVEYSGGAGADTNSQCSYAIYDGSSDYEIAASYSSAGSIFGVAGHSVVCYSSAQTNKEFTLRVKRVAGASTCQVNTTIGIGHNLTITPLDQKIPAPVLVGSVTNGSTGAMRIEAAKIAAPSAGSCVVTESGSSDWINGNGTSGSTGNCSMTFNSGVWSAAPICTCSQSGSNSKICSINAAETTTTVVTQTVTDGGAASDSIVNLHCIGPR